MEGAAVAAANWSVRGGKLPPPTSDDYNLWTVDQVRRECTARKITLSRSVSKQERIAELVRSNQYKAAVCREARGAEQDEQASRKTKNRAVRLLNVLFSDRFAPQFATLGNHATRRDLDTKTTGVPSAF